MGATTATGRIFWNSVPSSRGETIITQKENKGEYNGIQCSGKNICSVELISSNWYWDNSDYDYNTYAHVFDQNGKRDTTNGIPIRYANNTTDYHTTDNIPQCTSDYSTTSGNTLYSGTRITNQKSCNPNTLNAGNWYSFPTATAGSNNASTSSETDMPNSICPKGWRLPPNTGNKSYNTLIRIAYGISDTASDTNLLNNSAMSFVRFGHYFYNYGSISNRGAVGSYQTSTTCDSINSYRLSHASSLTSPQRNNSNGFGTSIRCVSR